MKREPLKRKSEGQSGRFMCVGVSVPNELRKAMLAIASEYEVNWSAIATEAFQAVVDQHEKTKGPLDKPTDDP